MQWKAPGNMLTSPAPYLEYYSDQTKQDTVTSVGNECEFLKFNVIFLKVALNCLLLSCHHTSHMKILYI